MTYGKRVETLVARHLRNQGLRVGIQSCLSPYDLLCNGKRVEVKGARLTRQGAYSMWSFNIHRHNVLNEANVDVYIFRLEKVPEFKNAIYLVIPAPIGSKRVSITLKSLLAKWGMFYNKFEYLK